MQDRLLAYLEHVPFATELAAWAQIESGSDDAEGLAQFAALLSERFHQLGATVAPVGDTHLLARWPGVGKPVLILGHFDTVYPRGTLASQPVAF